LITRFFTLNLTLLCLLCPGLARAQLDELFRSIRDTDLNNFAVGAAVSSRETGYIDSDGRKTLFPYLSSLTNPAFTDRMVFATEGELGVRTVTETDWTIGLMGRLETRSLEADADQPTLQERKSTLELGSAIAYRAWPVHLGIRSYFDVMGRHKSNRSKVEISYPVELNRGFIIPAIEFARNTRQYNDYYYGVTPSESTNTLPAYNPEASWSPGVKIKMGYRISTRWSLRGRIGLEFLDDEIAGSPLMEDDKLWSLSIGADYNADIFQPRSLELADDARPKSEIRIGLFSNRMDSKVQRNDDDGNFGSIADLESVLGISEQKTVSQFDALLRFGNYHRLEIGYLEVDRSGQAIIEEDLKFGDTTFPAGTNLASSSERDILKLSYGYSLILNAQAEFGVSAGLHRSNNKTQFADQDNTLKASDEIAPLLPVVGIYASVALGERVNLLVDGDLFRLDFNNYVGSQTAVNLELQYDLNVFGFGLGYAYHRSKLEAKKDSLSGRLNFRHSGPFVFAAYRF